MISSMPSDAPSSTESAEETSGFWPRLWWRVIHRLSPPANADALRDVVKELIEEPLSESGISSAERMLLANIIKLRKCRVSDCMIPRADIVAVGLTDSISDLVEAISAHGYSRIPVYRDKLDDVIGMAHVKDVVPHLAAGQSCAIEDLLRPVLYVAPSMPAARLLLQMRQTRHHMAIVIDEFGGTDGIVTIEDLVEEIVGDIEDEHDPPTLEPFRPQPDGSLLADARMTLADFESQARLALPPLDGEEIDTLGGYVTHLAGHIPHVGESVSAEGGLSFDVLEMDQSRVSRLRIRLPRETPYISSSGQ